MHPLLAIVLSYLLGSIPAAYIAGKSRGIDLRTQGSGNLGATNVFRVLGAKIGIAVFVFDMAKGAVPAALFPRWSDPLVTPAWWGGDPRLVLGILCGVAAIFGHVRPIFLRFGKGGKGVATSAGVFFGLAPIATLASLVTFIVVVFVSGYVSLGSLTGAVVLPMILWFTHAPSTLFWVSVALAVFVFWTHRANIGRLRRGEENRFGKRKGTNGGTVSGAMILLALAAGALTPIALAAWRAH